MVISRNFHEKSTFLCGICSESHKLSLITRKTRQIQNEGHSKGYQGKERMTTCQTRGDWRHMRNKSKCKVAPWIRVMEKYSNSNKAWTVSIVTYQCWFLSFDKITG